MGGRRGKFLKYFIYSYLKYNRIRCIVLFVIVLRKMKKIAMIVRVCMRRHALSIKITIKF